MSTIYSYFCRNLYPLRSMEKQDEPLAMVIGKMMNETLKVLKKRIYEQTDAKLTFDQFGLLYAIKQEKQEVIQKDMVEVMGKDKSVILRIIDSLEEKELVRRVVDMNDRRKNQILVTKKGLQTIDQYLEIEFRVKEELLDGVSQSDVDTFYKVLGHIQTKAEQINAQNS